MAYATLLNGYQPHQHSFPPPQRSERRHEKPDHGPANCWTYDSKGLREGITLDLQHPLVNGPALIMGEGTWVLLDKFQSLTNICRPDREGLYALMRRATLQMITREKGKPFPVFTKLVDKVNYHLVYVNSELPGVTPKIELLSQIVGDAAMSAGDHEGLYVVTNEQPIFVFYKDGSVVRLVDDMGQLRMIKYDREQTLDQRLDYIQWLLGEAGDIQDVLALVRREDWLCHQLVSMLQALQHVRDIAERDKLQAKVVDLLVDLYDEGMLRPAVRQRLAMILDRCADMIRWRFEAGSLTSDSSEKLSPEQLAKRQARLKKRKDNAEARAAANRKHEKGPSTPADKKGYGKGKKK